jgi:hypothetical protein
MRRFERNQRPIPPLHFSEFAPNPEVKKWPIRFRACRFRRKRYALLS